MRSPTTTLSVVVVVKAKARVTVITTATVAVAVANTTPLLEKDLGSSPGFFYTQLAKYTINNNYLAC